MEESGINPPPPDSLTGSRALVMGLGRFGGGIGVTRWLAEQGVAVSVTDQANPDELRTSLDKIADLDVEFHLGGHDPKCLANVDFVVVNPAVNKTRSEFFGEILKRKIPWTTEINLFLERCKGKLVAITGSYGKSTTCAMLADALEEHEDILSTNASHVYLGGNIGRSLLGTLDCMGPSDWVVLELSNAQLEDIGQISFAPQLVAITNLHPHHLDRYGSYREYIDAKLNIGGGPTASWPVVVGDVQNDAYSWLGEKVGDPNRIHRLETLDAAFTLNIPGDHNRRNAECVIAIGLALKLNPQPVLDALTSFKGLPHRLQHVRTLDGVDYFNDSKSTSPDNTVSSIQALDRPVVVIVGGKEKMVSLDACAELLAKKARAIICVGQSGPRFAKAIREAPKHTYDLTVTIASGLEQATQSAQRLAKPGDAVLFSPGAPSFDTHANFAERGDHFIETVRGLA